MVGSDATLRAQVLLQLEQGLDSIGDPRAVQIGLDGLALCSELGDDYRFATLASNTGYSEYNRGHWREALRRFGAAEAAYRLLEPKATAFVATPLTPPGKLPPDKALQAVMGQLQKQLVFVRGSADMDPEGLNEAGGLCGDLIGQVDLYRAPEWTYAAAILRARLLGHVADSSAELPLPEGLPEAKLKQLRGLLTMLGDRMRQLAMGALTAAWQDAQRRNLQTARVSDLKRELNRFKPSEFPLSRERSRSWLEPTDPAVQDGLAAALDLEAVRACFDRHMAAHPDQLLGELTLALTIGSDGSAGEVEVKGESELVGECVRKRWRSLTNLPHGATPRLVRLKLQYAAF